MCRQANSNLPDQIKRAIGHRPRDLQPLHGGCIASVVRADFTNAPPLVIKHDDRPNPRLDVEGFMLRFLAEHSTLPVPRVIHAEPALLVLEHIGNDAQKAEPGEIEAADALAELHTVSADRFGFKRNTLIGPLDQPNPWTDSWGAFYRDHRLLHYGVLADRAGSLPSGTTDRLRRLGDNLERKLAAVGPPSLVHGDCWSGNVLWHAGHLAAFIDPAVHFAHAEVELAFIDLMGNMSPAFWMRYNQHRPIPREYKHFRRPLYQLYPLLVHATLFGGGYGQSVAHTLDQLGV